MSEVKAADHYEPDPPVLCPICGNRLYQWKGGEGPCEELLWREKVAEPSLRLVGESKRSNEELKNLRLEHDVTIATTCAHCYGGHLQIKAHCTVQDHTWVDTEISEVLDPVSNTLFYSKYE